MAKTIEEKKEISKRVNDIIEVEAIDIVNKLNECFLNFNLNDLGIIVSYRSDIISDIFPKYNKYRYEGRLSERHLIKNDFFDEFCIIENRLSLKNRCLNEKSSIAKLIYSKKEISDTRLQNIIDEYISCLESFSEYIGYDMRIGEHYQGGTVVTFKKNKEIMNRVENYLNSLTKGKLIDLLESFGATQSEIDIARASTKANIVANILKNHLEAADKKLSDSTDDKINNILD